MAETAQHQDSAAETSSPATVTGEQSGTPEIAAATSADIDLSEKEFTEFFGDYSSKYHIPHVPDELNGRYHIELNQPLPELNSSMAEAYAVSDREGGDTALYGLVLSAGIPYRYKTINALMSMQHPNMIHCVSEGVIKLSTSGELRKTVIFEQPRGKPLSRLLAEHKQQFSEQFILRSVLAPLNEILQALQKHGINHGRINLNSIYMDGNDIMLGECVSEPSGYSQHFLFEPMERAMALPLGKGSGDMSGDCYALGVLACLLNIGRDISLEMDEQNYLENILQNGSYNVLTRGHNISDNLQDLLRGTLNDNTKERWTPEHISKWLGGKRYNLIPPSSPKESSRPVVFLEQDYFSRKALAHALYIHAESAYQILEDNKLVRWAELSLHKKEVAEQLETIVHYAEGEKPHSSRMRFLVARTIITLDPSGPLRIASVSAHIDGLGNILAGAWHNHSQDTIQDIAQIIDNDLITYWSDVQTSPESPNIAAILWKIQKMRQYLRYNSLGFGMERALYDLNPSLPCQSELIKSHHVSDIRELLEALDDISREKHSSHAPLDRHIAAFLASKMDLAKEQRIPELTFDRELSNNPKLTGLKMLALAQEKSGSPSLPGLAHWMALHTFPIVEKVHNRETRQTVIKEIRNAAARGKLAQLEYIHI